MKRLLIALGLVLAFQSCTLASNDWLVRSKKGGIALYPDGQVKLDVCHKGKTINVSWEGWINGHKKHGDYLGRCKEEKPVPQEIHLVQPYWMYMTWIIEAHQGRSESYVNYLTNLRDNEVDHYITYNVVAPSNIAWNTLQYVDFTKLVDFERLVGKDPNIRYGIDGIAWAQNQADEWAKAHGVVEARIGLTKYVDFGRMMLSQYYLVTYPEKAQKVYIDSIRIH